MTLQTGTPHMTSRSEQLRQILSFPHARGPGDTDRCTTFVWFEMEDSLAIRHALNRQSAICNLQSSIVNPPSSLPNNAARRCQAPWSRMFSGLMSRCTTPWVWA